MKAFCAAFPILPGRTEALREFAKAVMSSRRREYSDALKRQGMTTESWFLQKTPKGDMIIAYFEADDVQKAFEIQAKSKGPFDVWFKLQVKSATGFDLEQPSSEPPPEEICHI